MISSECSVQGVTYPSLLAIWQNWAPPGECSRLLAISFAGQSRKHPYLAAWFSWCFCHKKGIGSPYSITEHRVPELIPVFASQPTGDVSYKPGDRLPLLSARPAVTPATLKRAATSFTAWWTEARWVWTVCLRHVTWQCCSCDLNPGPTAPESSMLTTRLPSHPIMLNYI